MTYSRYTITPSDGTVVLDEYAAFGVNMYGIPSNVHAIQWSAIKGYGLIEPKADPLTGLLGPSIEYTDYGRFQNQLDEAEAIIYAYEHPVTYYSTADNNLYEGITYNIGFQIVITIPNETQPPNTTLLLPPTPEVFQTLYWLNDAWVVSSVNPALNLISAKSYLTNAVLTSVAENVNDQTRVYSNFQMSISADPENLLCADYPTTTLDSYQISETAAGLVIINQIESATVTSDLYDLNPNVI